MLYGCINEATNNELTLFLRKNKDLCLSVEVEIMQHQEVFMAEDKGKEVSKKIKSIDYEDFADKKPIFSSCVSFAFSQDIDSIACLTFKNKN